MRGASIGTMDRTLGHVSSGKIRCWDPPPIAAAHLTRHRATGDGCGSCSPAALILLSMSWNFANSPSSACCNAVLILAYSTVAARYMSAAMGSPPSCIALHVARENASNSPKTKALTSAKASLWQHCVSGLRPSPMALLARVESGAATARWVPGTGSHRSKLISVVHVSVGENAPHAERTILSNSRTSGQSYAL